jgi:hypothetical protein
VWLSVGETPASVHENRDEVLACASISAESRCDTPDWDTGDHHGCDIRVWIERPSAVGDEPRASSRLPEGIARRSRFTFAMRALTFGSLSGRTPAWLGFGVWLGAALAGCSNAATNDGNGPDIDRPTTPTPQPTGSENPTGPTEPSPGTIAPAPTTSDDIIPIPSTPAGCETFTCAELGWACGYVTDECGDVINCADEGLECASGEVCIGGIDSPTRCEAGGGGSCELCSFLPKCEDQPQTTRLTGRVITPGRSDDDTGNQVGVPNALVYILQNNTEELPEIPVGVPSGGTACDRCEDQQAQLGDVLFGAVTDATGAFTIEEYVPVGHEFTLVVKAGKFRRATRYTIPESSACQTVALPTALPDNPTRLPRDMADGSFVHLPKIAVSTGQIDAMECVFEKMGLAHSEFGNPGADGAATPRIHLYRGGSAGSPAGAAMDAETPHAEALYGTLERLQSYDMVVADCEGPSYDNGFQEAEASGSNVREYVNRGGRMFASHLSFTWLHENGEEPYTEATPIETGLGPAAGWDTNATSAANVEVGMGFVSLDSPNASPRIEDFVAWLTNESVVTPPENSFTIIQPRSQVVELGEHTEQFLHCDDSDADGDCIGNAARIQQFSFNTPYGAPDEASCGRVAYSGFHVAATQGAGGTTGSFEEVTFPEHCVGDLTDQEKVLLYMLFDLGACVGDPPPPPECTPKKCEDLNAQCGFAPDGCGDVVDCGPCTRPPTR